MQPKFAEKPRVRIGVVSVSMGLKREQYFIGHTWSPYFSETRGRPYAYECYQILQSKNMECKKTFNVQPKLFWGKSVEKSSQTLLTLGQLLVEDITRKILQESSTVVSLRNWAYSLLHNRENTSQLSHKSRVLHTSRVCAPAGVYKRVGAPAFLTFCFIPMSTKYICNWRWK